MSGRTHRLLGFAAALLACGLLVAGPGCAPLSDSGAGANGSAGAGGGGADSGDAGGGAGGGVDSGRAGGEGSDGGSDSGHGGAAPDTAPGRGGSGSGASDGSNRRAPGKSGRIGELPGCHRLIPALQVHERFSPMFETWAGPDDEAKRLQLAAWLGPTALDAYAAATEVRHCYWGVPLSDVIVSTFTAVLPEAAGAQLVASLRQSHYLEIPGQGATLFTHTWDDGTWRQTNWYGFTGDVWVASFGYGDRVPVDLILENLRQQHPDWKPGAP